MVRHWIFLWNDELMTKRDICFFYKCMLKYYNSNVDEYTNIITGRTRNAINSNLRPNRVCTFLFRDSFFNCIVPLWNNISLDICETKALSTFKDRLFNYFFNKFIAIILTHLEFKHGKQPLPNWQIFIMLHTYTSVLWNICKISVTNICHISATDRNLASFSYLPQICNRYRTKPDDTDLSK